MRCLKRISVSAGDDKPSSTAVNLKLTALMCGTAVSVQGRICVIQCYGRRVTPWEEQ